METESDDHFRNKSLSNMSLEVLFGKLQEHDFELIRLEQHEEGEKNIDISLKVESKVNQQEDSLDADDNITRLMKKYGKFFQKVKNK